LQKVTTQNHLDPAEWQMWLPEVAPDLVKLVKQLAMQHGDCCQLPVPSAELTLVDKQRRGSVPPLARKAVHESEDTLNGHRAQPDARPRVQGTSANVAEVR
jgi:hypothetical protein